MALEPHFFFWAFERRRRKFDLENLPPKFERAASPPATGASGRLANFSFWARQLLSRSSWRHSPTYGSSSELTLLFGVRLCRTLRCPTLPHLFHLPNLVPFFLASDEEIPSNAREYQINPGELAFGGPLLRQIFSCFPSASASHTSVTPIF